MKDNISPEYLKRLRKANLITQETIANHLKVDIAVISRIENGKTPNPQLMEKMLLYYTKQSDSEQKMADIHIQQEQLRVASSSTHHAAPLLVWMSDAGSAESLEKVQYTFYTEGGAGKLIFNESGKKLAAFDRTKNDILESTNIKNLVKNRVVDIGFLSKEASINEKELIALGRLTSTVRGGVRVSVIAPKDTFSKDEEKNREELRNIRKDLMEKQENKYSFFLRDNSAERFIYETYFQKFGFDYELVDINHLDTFQTEMNKKITAYQPEKGKFAIYIGGILTTEALKSQLEKEGSYEIESIEASLFSNPHFNMRLQSFDFICHRDNNKMTNLKENATFKRFLNDLQTAVTNLNDERNKTESGIPPLHRKIAAYLGMADEKLASDYLKRTTFDLVLYPEILDRW
jgi:DNA-binding XRE family transcriptional regulator